jgi:uncharacterized protein YyaL (SSP411 family)
MHTVAASITAVLLRADARGERLGPAGVTFLVRRYAATGASELRGALERGLTGSLEELAAGQHPQAAWIHALCEAAAVTDDQRILDAVAVAAQALRQGWPSRGAIADAMRGVDACLTAAVALDDRDLIGAAVDELERVTCMAYHPGEMLPRSLRSADDADGGIDEHVAAAAALLTAHDVTARLPYSMLAEELIQTLQRSGECESSGGLDGPRDVILCALARTLCRLARLHDDEAYRQAAVIARACDYRADAKNLLERIALSYSEPLENVAGLGVAMDDLARAS